MLQILNFYLKNSKDSFDVSVNIHLCENQNFYVLQIILWKFSLLYVGPIHIYLPIFFYRYHFARCIYVLSKNVPKCWTISLFNNRFASNTVALQVTKKSFGSFSCEISFLAVSSWVYFTFFQDANEGTS